MPEIAAYLALSAAEAPDPITALLTRDWAALGGWSLFIGLCLFNVTGFFREWVVPGARYRRLELSAEKNSDALKAAVSALDKQVTANEITKHFFEETVPKRGEVKSS